MPVRSLSLLSRPAMYARASLDEPRSLSSSGENPALMTPPSARLTGGSSTMAASMSRTVSSFW